MGVWREALEGLGEVELAESSVEVDFQEEADVSVFGVFCGSAHGSSRGQLGAGTTRRWRGGGRQERDPGSQPALGKTNLHRFTFHRNTIT